MGGGLAFAAFSAAIDLLFIRRETPEYVFFYSFPPGYIDSSSQSNF